MEFLKNFKKTLPPIILGLLAYTPAQAQIPQGRPITLGTIQLLVIQIASFLIFISGTVAVIFIIWSGIKYMMAGDDTTKATEAKGQLKSAIIGAAIVFGVGVILVTIQNIVTCGSFYSPFPC